MQQRLGDMCTSARARPTRPNAPTHGHTTRPPAHAHTRARHARSPHTPSLSSPAYAARGVTARRHVRPPTRTQRESDVTRARIGALVCVPQHTRPRTSRVARTKREGGTTGTRALTHAPTRPRLPIPPASKWGF